MADAANALICKGAACEMSVIIKGHATRLEYSLIKQLDAGRERVVRADKDESTVWILSTSLLQDRARYLGSESLVESLSSSLSLSLVLFCT